MSRTIVIGDLHGCFDETVELLKKCNASSNDRVIFLGDLIDRGPDNDKCVDLVREIEQRQGQHACIFGNHEEKHLEHIKIFEETGKLPGMPRSHEETRKQLKAEHYEYFKTLPLFIRIPEFNVACVHAGAFPGRELEQQSQKHLLHIQMINPNETERTYWANEKREGFKFWTHFWTGPERLIFGHSVLDRPLVTPNAIGIDGGAVFGRDLHALILPEFKIETVKGVKDWGKGSRGTSGKSVQLFNVHGDVNTFS